MNRKKNIFSYLMWFAYTIMTCGMLSVIACSLCGEAGMQRYWGILAAVLFLAGAGGISFWLHRSAAALSSFAAGKRRLFLLLEAVSAAGLLSVGLILRLYGLESAGQMSDYYEAARVAEGWEAPRMPQRAVSFYVRMLHGAFILLGNHFMVGIWIQMILQLAALLILYFMARKLAGSVCALVVLGFGACGSYMVEEALVLSPRMLYFLLFVTVAALTAAAARAIGVKGFYFTGFLSALCMYLDLAGVLLVFFNVSAFSYRWQEKENHERLAAVWRYTLSLFLGVFVCLLADASFSKTTIWQAAETWFSFYSPGVFRLSVSAEAWNYSEEAILLSGLMAFGIFSFWRGSQKGYMTVCMLGISGITLAGCYGGFTEEMPGTIYIYMLLVLLAGLGLERSLHRTGQIESGERYSWEALIEKMEENESLREAREAFGEGVEEEAPAPKMEPYESLEEETPAENQEWEEPEGENLEEGQIQYIENPLPLPKKHVKRVLDYSLPASEEDDFDYSVSEEDDFDI